MLKKKMHENTWDETELEQFGVSRSPYHPKKSKCLHVDTFSKFKSHVAGAGHIPETSLKEVAESADISAFSNYDLTGF